MIFDLFISYKSIDHEYAKAIREALLSIDPSLNIFWSEKTLEVILDIELPTTTMFFELVIALSIAAV